ncbi:hypothetical protein PRK78_006923 [Emydomyces testavorans]|uniref:Uncharacterized protein n=1 Tax=Emydomyces testavorans TaxID=2070801 RepID=A0AAF0DNF4_9EURO|nr:hypothetical protein PRK78_006923 [Emydomyces testavorans]
MNIQGAATAVHIALSNRLIPYVIIGRYAIELLRGHDVHGLETSTSTLTILVECSKEHAVNVLINSSQPFGLTSVMGLVYDPDVGYISADPIYVEIHQSQIAPYFLPWVTQSPKIRRPINAMVDMLVLHPKMLVIAAARFWDFSSEEYFVQIHLTDVRLLLCWLNGQKMKIAIDAYNGPERRAILMTFSSLYSLHEDIRKLLEGAMRPEDFETIKDGNIPRDELDLPSS